jgi:hypothetical protein
MDGGNQWALLSAILLMALGESVVSLSVSQNENSAPSELAHPEKVLLPAWRETGSSIQT